MSINTYWPYYYYFAWSRTCPEVLVCLAVYFACSAADTTGIVVLKSILAHFLPPFAATGLICMIVSVMAHPPPAGSNS